MYFRVMLINFSVLAKYHFICTRFIFPLTGNVRCHKKDGAKKICQSPFSGQPGHGYTLRNTKPGKNNARCEKQESNLRTPSGTDLESASVGHLDILAHYSIGLKG